MENEVVNKKQKIGWKRRIKSMSRTIIKRIKKGKRRSKDVVRRVRSKI
jgi:hypothetical protein